MSAPPAKRQRRLVLSSEDEESGGDINSTTRKGSQSKEDEKEDDSLISASHFSNPPSTTLRTTRASTSTSILPSRSKPKILASGINNAHRRITRSPSTQGSLTPSPEKKRKVVKKGSVKDEPATKSLHSFFKPATEEQRWQRRNIGPEKSAKEDLEDDIEDDDDMIEDDFSDDGLAVMSQLAANASLKGTAAGAGGGSFGSRSTASSTQGRVGKETSKLGSKGSGARKLGNTDTKKRFILPTSPVRETRSSSKTQTQVSSGTEELQPWSERFPPLGLDELAVHKRKVADVQRWLEDVFLGRNRRVCILRCSFLPLLRSPFLSRTLIGKRCLTVIETSCSQGTCWQWKDDYCFVTV